MAIKFIHFKLQIRPTMQEVCWELLVSKLFTLPFDAIFSLLKFRYSFILPSCSLRYIYENEKPMIGTTLDCNGIYDTTRILSYGNIILVGFTKIFNHRAYIGLTSI